MNWRSLASVIALATLSGCIGFIVDGDGDGLWNGKEEEFGSDPQNADSDADGLEDGEEVDLGLDPMNGDMDADRLLDGEEGPAGTDPLVADSDDDGYADGDEINEGHDPLDAKDRIYKGRWPYYWDKDSLKGGGATAENDKRFKRMQFVDQHNETVDLWDFYNADKPVVIDISAEWCPPCNGLASWLDGGVDSYGFGSLWPNGPEIIERGDVYWITILGEDVYGAPAYQEVTERWHDLYPTKEIPVLADGDYTSADYVGLGFWPSLFLLTPDLKIRNTGSWGDAGGVLSTLNSEVPE
jgi:thiol-disulfide isomerase/thioredoxin